MHTELSVAPELLIHDSGLNSMPTRPIPNKKKGELLPPRGLDTLMKVHATLDWFSSPRSAECITTPDLASDFH
jgi:hypothetical protein